MFLLEALQQSLDLKGRLKILDLCAAPGGKSTLLASAISSESMLLANEVIQSRMAPLKMNLEKWGCSNLFLSNHDPADFQEFHSFFDLVVADAPCSGEGLFRKGEAAVSEWSEKNLALCAARQRRILASAAQWLRAGGVLIYSTCTFNADENEKNVQWLIQNSPFEEISLRTDPAWGIVKAENGYYFFPHRVRGEGFFIACLRKLHSSKAPAGRKPAGKLPWQELGKKEQSLLAGWLEAPEQFNFFVKPEGDVVALPQDLTSDVVWLTSRLKRRSSGLVIGTLKNRNFVPSHALALSKAISTSIPSVELDKEQALLFLKKENFQMPEVQKGWVLARYKGLNLGWLKMLEQRFNNYLPYDWRIRMKIE